MTTDNLKKQLAIIYTDLEEVIGATLGHAPADFYSEDEDSNEVIIKSKISQFANKVDQAYDRLNNLINKL
ncbi:MAG: hypothetical protein KAJ40_00540 [Alphaproteobacteria bacterium]|nr:hypothetical protein [Alphaproteobacteria bacterium]